MPGGCHYVLLPMLLFVHSCCWLLHTGINWSRALLLCCSWPLSVLGRRIKFLSTLWLLLPVGEWRARVGMAGMLGLCSSISIRPHASCQHHGCIGNGIFVHALCVINLCFKLSIVDGVPFCTRQQYFLDRWLLDLNALLKDTVVQCRADLLVNCGLMLFELSCHHFLLYLWACPSQGSASWGPTGRPHKRWFSQMVSCGECEGPETNRQLHAGKGQLQLGHPVGPLAFLAFLRLWVRLILPTGAKHSRAPRWV